MALFCNKSCTALEETALKNGIMQYHYDYSMLRSEDSIIQ